VVGSFGFAFFVPTRPRERGAGRDTLRARRDMKTLATTLAIIGLLTAQSGYTGLWYRVDDKSDDPGPKLEAAIAGFIQKMSRGRDTVEDVDPEFVKRLNQVLERFVQYADELDIERSSRELVVDDGGDNVLAVGEGDDGELDPQHVGQLRLQRVVSHDLPPCGW